MSAYRPALSLIQRFLGPEMTKFISRRIILLLRFSHYRPSIIVPMYQAKVDLTSKISTVKPVTTDHRD